MAGNPLNPGDDNVGRPTIGTDPAINRYYFAGMLSNFPEASS